MNTPPTNRTLNLIVVLGLVVAVSGASWYLLTQRSSSAAGSGQQLASSIDPNVATLDSPLLPQSRGSKLPADAIAHLSFTSPGWKPHFDRFIARVRALKLYQRQNGDQLIEASYKQVLQQAALSSSGAFTEPELETFANLLWSSRKNPGSFELIVGSPKNWRPSPQGEGEMSKLTLPALFASATSAGLPAEVMKVLYRLIDSNIIPSSGENFSLKKDPSGKKIVAAIGDGTNFFMPISLIAEGDSIQLMLGAASPSALEAGQGEPTLKSSPVWESLSPQFKGADTNYLYLNLSPVKGIFESLAQQAPSEEQQAQLRSMSSVVDQQTGGVEGVLSTLHQAEGEELWSMVKSCASFQTGSSRPGAMKKILAERVRTGRAADKLPALIDTNTLFAATASLDLVDILLSEIERVMAGATEQISAEDKTMVIDSLRELRSSIDGLQIQEVGLLLQSPRPGPIPLPIGTLVFSVGEIEPKAFFEKIRGIMAEAGERASGAPLPDEMLPVLGADSDGSTTLTLELSPPFALHGRQIGPGLLGIGTDLEHLKELSSAARQPSPSITAKLSRPAADPFLSGPTDYTVFVSLKALGNAARPFLSMVVALPEAQSMQITAEELSEAIDLLGVGFYTTQRTVLADDTKVCTESFSDIL
jgi:hypothetical protein